MARNAARNEDLYVLSGFLDREDYLRHVAEETGYSLNDVWMVAAAIGENDDLDKAALVAELNEYM